MPRVSNLRSPGSRVTTPPSQVTRVLTPPEHGQQRTIIRNAPKQTVLSGDKSLNPSLGDGSNLLSQFNDYDAASEFNDLLTDPLFSKILDGVDIGEDNNIDQISINCDQSINQTNLAKQKIHEIEQSLKQAEPLFSPNTVQPSSDLSQAQIQGLTSGQAPGQGITVMTNTSSGLILVTQQQQQQQFVGSVIQTQPQQRILQQRSSGLIIDQYLN